MSKTYETIKYEVEDRILTITLNRPDRLNAFNRQMQMDLIDAFDQADADDDVRAIIVTGEGRGFCAGADLGPSGGARSIAAANLSGATRPSAMGAGVLPFGFTKA